MKSNTWEGLRALCPHCRTEVGVLVGANCLQIAESAPLLTRPPVEMKCCNCGEQFTYRSRAVPVPVERAEGGAPVRLIL